MPEELQQAGLTWRVSPDMMCVLDGEGRFVAVNPAWQAVLGWSREEMVGRPYIEFLHPEDVARSNEAFETVKGGKPVLRFENRYRTTDGEYRWFSWVAVPEKGRYFCTVRDVTDDKRNVETISEQRVEADLREQFLAVLGHDLRNPLAALQAGISVLARRSPDDTSGGVLRQMDQCTDRMSELIDNMMDLARVRLGDGIGLEPRVVEDIAAEIEQIIAEVRAGAIDREFEFECAGGGTVTCDLPRVKQVLANLLGNAVTHGLADEPIRVACLIGGGRLRVSISNAGQEIDEAARSRLFQPFFRGEVRSSQQGLGLGLYIAAEIVKAHGGTLDVYSDANETCFTVDIPA